VDRAQARTGREQRGVGREFPQSLGWPRPVDSLALGADFETHLEPCTGK